MGTLAHPLNRPQFDPQQGRVVAGYGILQPRVSFHLMAATRSNLEPIFLVYSAYDGDAAARPSRTTEVVDQVADSCPPLVTAVTGDGITHRLWRLEDPARLLLDL